MSEKGKSGNNKRSINNNKYSTNRKTPLRPGPIKKSKKK